MQHSEADARLPAKYSPELARRPTDLVIRTFAESQHGVVTLGQLEELGLSARAVRDRVATGRLTRLHRGVFAVGMPTAEGRLVAAVLASGEGSLISHRSAAVLWGLRAEARSRIDVTVRGSTGRSRSAIDVHSGILIEPEDVAQRRGIPCTSLARTLLDLASAVDRRSLERAVDRAEELRAFDLVDLRRIMTRCRGRRGVGALAVVLECYEGATVTRSEAEERMLALVEAGDLPKPELNAWLPISGGAGYRADLLWRGAGLVVEVDGRTFHAKRRAFRHDRQRDRRLALAGFETRRYDATEIIDDPTRVVSELRAFLVRSQA